MIKTHFKIFIVFIATILFCFKSFARIIVVSDIDDTVKISRVNSVLDKFDLVFNTDSRFKGMSELYNGLEKDHNTNLDFFYLSNAPSWPMQFWHEELLREGQFPLGHVQLREDESEDMHKVVFLRKWIKALAPATVILLGDNGEKDALFYYQIVDEFAYTGIQFLQFIRIVYANPEAHKLLPGQVGFVTPIEIILELNKHGLLSAKTSQNLLQNLETQILAESKSDFGEPAFFPDWLACPHWQAPVFLQPNDIGYRAINKISSLCYAQGNSF